MPPFGRLVLGLLIGLSSSGFAGGAGTSPNEVFDQVRKITTPDGIHERKLVRIGGLQQWVSVRGRHRDNPYSFCKVDSTFGRDNIAVALGSTVRF